MIIDHRNHSNVCACGEPHRIVTRYARIEAGCMQSLPACLAEAGLSGHSTAVYDTNTYQAEGLIRPKVDQEIILDAKDLCADDGAVATVMHRLRQDTEVLVAIGGGTIHDIVRYCAFKRGLPFVSCPTAASGDAYCASVSTIAWRGAQALLPGVAPVFVLADVDILRRAPAALARAGVGDAVSRFTALADWKIAGLVTDRPSCAVAESMLWQSAIAAQGACIGLADNQPGAHAQLMYAQLLSGMASQLLGDVRGGAAAEHLLACLLETMPALRAATPQMLHGERVGICAAAIADLYHHIVRAQDTPPSLKPYKPLDAAWMTRHFGETLGALLMDANTPDCLLAVDPARLSQQWEAIRRVIEEMPDGKAIRTMLVAAGMEHSTLEALGVSGAKLLPLSACLRNQLTLVRLLRLIKPRYASSDLAFRAPSRNSRYADKAITRAGKSKAMSGSTMR